MTAIAFDAAVGFDSPLYTFDGIALSTLASGVGDQDATLRSDQRALVSSDQRATFRNDQRATILET